MTFLRGIGLAALLTTTLAAGSCVSGPRTLIQPVPPLDPALAEPCADPGVASDAFVALVENRLAFVECANKHYAAVQSWPAQNGE